MTVGSLQHCCGYKRKPHHVSFLAVLTLVLRNSDFKIESSDLKEEVCPQLMTSVAVTISVPQLSDEDWSDDIKSGVASKRSRRGCVDLNQTKCTWYYRDRWVVTEKWGLPFFLSHSLKVLPIKRCSIRNTLRRSLLCATAKCWHTRFLVVTCDCSRYPITTDSLSGFSVVACFSPLKLLRKKHVY